MTTKILFLCQFYKFSTIKPDQILTLLIAASDYHLKREVVAKLVQRLAQEDKATWNRLKISRYLPSQVIDATRVFLELETSVYCSYF